MTTNRLGEGTANIAVNAPVELREKLRGLAKSSGMSLSLYCRSVLERAASNSLRFERRIIEAPEESNSTKC